MQSDSRSAAPAFHGRPMIRFAVLAAVWATLWSGAFAATKIAVSQSAPMTVVAIRCTVAGALMVALSWRATGGPPKKGLGGLIIVGVLNNTGYLGLIAAALPHVSVGMAAILTSTIPIVVLVISALQGEQLRMVQWAGCIIGFIGVTGSALTRLGSGDTTGGGIAIGSAAVACLIAGTVLTPKLVPPGSPWMSTGVQSLAGGLPLAVGAFIFDGAPDFTPRFFIAVAYLIVGASVFGMTLWLMIIREFGPERAAAAHFLPPLVSLGLGVVLLDEIPSVAAVVMCAPAALGVYLATRPPASPPTRNRSGRRRPSTS